MFQHFINTLFLSLCFWSLIFGDQASHHEAAYHLFQIVKETIPTSYIDTIQNHIIRQAPHLSNKKKDIHSLLEHFIHSLEYQKLWTKALMHFFTEEEIREITIQVKNSTFSKSTAYRSKLYHKYERVFQNLEKKFIEIMGQKLKSK